jgi:hypothetical protein
VDLEERRLVLEEQKLLLEKEKSHEQNKFFNKNFGAIITAAVTMATVVVSGAQVWVAHINKNKELELTNIQESQELKSADLERHRRWGLDVAKFVFENRALIYSGNRDEQEQIRNVMVATFPSEVTEKVFLGIETTASIDQKQVWADGQKAIDMAYLPVDESTALLQTVSTGEKITSESIAHLVEGFVGPERRDLSNQISDLYKKNPEAVIDGLLQGILPDSDRWSYRVNIYIARTLERIKPSWTGSDNQIKTVEELKNTSSYKNDEAFKARVDGAVSNFGEN